MDDPRFRTVADRQRESPFLEERLTAWFAGQTIDSAVARFSSLGVPINAINDIPRAANEPQLHERELLVEVPDPIAGTIHVSGKPIKLSRSETPVGSAPVPGQHTEELLGSLLNYTSEEIEKLENEGAIYRASQS